jgi:ribosomal protein S18 acetylase RimI-like enzyme
VRQATPLDIPAIVHLINRAYRIESPFVYGDRVTAADVAAMMAVPDSIFIIHDTLPLSSPELAGAVYVRGSGDRGYFGPLAVDPQRQGEGIGKALIAAVEAHCRNRGYGYLDLDVLSVRQELVRFYKRLGFTPTGVGEYPYPERLRGPAHLVLMTKTLDPDSNLSSGVGVR